MQLAFVLYKYFPFGGLQRDFMRIALECQQRGHLIRVYTLIWEGDIPPGFEVLVAPVQALFNHRRNEKLSAWMEADLLIHPAYNENTGTVLLEALVAGLPVLVSAVCG